MMSKVIIRRSQASKARAKKMLARVKPFDEWVRDEQATRLAERAFGVPAKDVYDMIVSGLQDVAANGVVTTVTARKRKMV